MRNITKIAIGLAVVAALSGTGVAVYRWRRDRKEDAQVKDGAGEEPTQEPVEMKLIQQGNTKASPRQVRNLLRLAPKAPTGGAGPFLEAPRADVVSLPQVIADAKKAATAGTLVGTEVVKNVAKLFG